MVQVGVIMGSISDWDTIKHACETLDELEIPYEKQVVSAHRTPDDMFDYAKTAKSRGLKVIIACAGGAAHLPGMVSSQTTLPVIGVPVKTSALGGLDSLLSIVQMPGGVPTATMAIGNAGAINAALFAERSIARSGAEVAETLDAYRENRRKKVEEMREELAKK